jgi:hypothetical protein
MCGWNARMRSLVRPVCWDGDCRLTCAHSARARGRQHSCPVQHGFEWRLFLLMGPDGDGSWASLATWWWQEGVLCACTASGVRTQCSCWEGTDAAAASGASVPANRTSSKNLAVRRRIVESRRKASARRISHFDSRRTAAVGVGNRLKHRAVLPRAQPPRRAGTPAAPLFDWRQPGPGFLGGQTDFAERLRALTYCTGNDAPQVETPSSGVVAS